MIKLTRRNPTLGESLSERTLKPLARSLTRGISNGFSAVLHPEKGSDHEQSDESGRDPKLDNFSRTSRSFDLEGMEELENAGRKGSIHNYSAHGNSMFFLGVDQMNSEQVRINRSWESSGLLGDSTGICSQNFSAGNEPIA